MAARPEHKRGFRLNFAGTTMVLAQQCSANAVLPGARFPPLLPPGLWPRVGCLTSDMCYQKGYHYQ